MIDISDIEIVVANASHVKYVDEVLETINHAAKVRGTGIAKRSPEYVKQKTDLPVWVTAYFNYIRLAETLFSTDYIFYDCFVFRN